MAAVSVSDAEWRVREELAALYRIAGETGWDEVIYNHISARVPGEEAVLLNEFGLRYEEITAGNLVKVDLQGRILSANREARLNAPGIVIHLAVHEARPDLECVIHHHNVHAITVASMKQPWVPLTQNMCIVNHRLAARTHPYEGIACNEAEKARLKADLGDREILLMENHGVIVGGTTIAAAYFTAFVFDRACMEFATMLATVGGDIEKLTPAPGPVVEDTQRLLATAGAKQRNSGWGRLEFAARCRGIRSTRWKDRSMVSPVLVAKL
eukprot:TRINITY_DN12750_c0_g2_i1.p1 TRINITY_DN12750_c0_g2~~TRINITY_DN12750_c0_g2_i1.p1  ORF type:complete len:269 (+),score=72.70 TRINITY_DN12750_c0_g2_i1:47-853(+)